MINVFIKGYEFLFCESGYELYRQHKWSESGDYLQRRFVGNGRPSHLLFHRELLGLKHGDGKIVDHINRNKRDNRRCNLRIATVSQNGFNRDPVRGSSSRYLGVYFMAGPHRSHRWLASMKFEKTRLNLGVYKTEEEAALVRDFAARVLHGEFARLNLPMTDEVEPD